MTTPDNVYLYSNFSLKIPSPCRSIVGCDDEIRTGKVNGHTGVHPDRSRPGGKISGRSRRVSYPSLRISRHGSERPPVIFKISRFSQESMLFVPINYSFTYLVSCKQEGLVQIKKREKERKRESIYSLSVNKNTIYTPHILYISIYIIYL